jgi:hypothetical protein
MVLRVVSAGHYPGNADGRGGDHQSEQGGEYRDSHEKRLPESVDFCLN